MEKSLTGQRSRKESGESAGRPELSQSPGRSTDCLGDSPSLYTMLCTHAFSNSCSRSWTLRLSSSAGGKLLPTFMKRAAILLLRRKPAARRRSPCKTQASTAAAETMVSRPCPAHAPQHPAQSHGHLGKRGPPESQVCDNLTGNSMYASPPSTPSKGRKRA